MNELNKKSSHNISIGIAALLAFAFIGCGGILNSTENIGKPEGAILFEGDQRDPREHGEHGEHGESGQFNFVTESILPYDQLIQAARGRQIVLTYTFLNQDNRNTYNINAGESIEQTIALEDDPTLGPHFEGFKTNILGIFDQISAVAPICFVESNDTQSNKYSTKDLV